MKCKNSRWLEKEMQRMVVVVWLQKKRRRVSVNESGEKSWNENQTE
jgi:hypothetical protein